ncbi:MAG: hypothetical protein ABL876_12500 [Chitinophagaceae bacterium]
MKKLLPVVIIALALWSCKNAKKEKTETTPLLEVKTIIDSTLVTDSAWGAITTKTDFAGLQSIFGAANVKDERICGPECIDSLDVTIIYPETNKEIIVHWKDSLYHKKIVYIETSGEEGPYRTPTGLKIGTTLRELLKLNGQKITFYGFGWDYGGYIQSYNSGTLEKSAVHFRLDLFSKSDDMSLLGDMELNTDMPAVQKKLDSIQVYHLSLFFSKDALDEY